MKQAFSLLGATAVAALLAVSPAAALTLDAGWEYDSIDYATDPHAPSAESPYSFTLTSDAYFRVTDAFLVGDSLSAFDSGLGLIGNSSGDAMASSFGDAAIDVYWNSSDYASFETLLTAGTYTIIITGDAGGGAPAGFYARLDSAPAVPLPASLPLLALGVAGFGMMKRRKKS